MGVVIKKDRIWIWRLAASKFEYAAAFALNSYGTVWADLRKALVPSVGYNATCFNSDIVIRGVVIPLLTTQY